MAHRIISQVVITGARVLGRSFAEAYRQAQASSKYQAAAAKASGGQSSSSSPSSRGTFGSSGMSLDEAVKILNVKQPKGGETDMSDVADRFKRLFDANDPKKGGSFYLQSKILRARERIEAEVAPHMEQKAAEDSVKEGLPKMYKDR